MVDLHVVSSPDGGAMIIQTRKIGDKNYIVSKAFFCVTLFIIFRTWTNIYIKRSDKKNLKISLKWTLDAV